MKSVFIITEIKIYKGNSAGASRMMNFAKALALEEVKVYLCSACLRNNISINSLEQIYHNIFLVGEEVKEQNGRIRKFYHLFHLIIILKYLLMIMRIAKQINGEIIFYIYPQPSISIDILSLFYIKLLHRYKLFYDVNELRRAGLYNRALSKNILKKGYDIVSYVTDYIKFYIEEILTKYYDGLVVISTNLEKYFKKYNDNLLKIPILSNTAENPFYKVPAYNDGETFLMCFAGWISLKKEGFDNFYKALSVIKSKHKEFVLHLYGPISKEQEKILLNGLPSEYRIKENIVYHGVVEQSALMEKLRRNHLLILPRPLNLQTKYGFSTKLSEYLVSGVPILVTDVSDNALYIKDGYNGFIVEPGDYKEMAEKIIYIITNYNDLKDIVSKNAYLTAEKYFNFYIYSDKLYNFLFGKGNIL